ncbi:MAG: hypothetical protein IPP88_24135 [Betaproteobacteria bacterium]|nr:hypothetical protein [Betaproteobacteria bacterium]
MKKLLAAMGIVVILSGCASGAKVEGMSVFADAATVNAKTALKNNVAVKDVTGGQDTNPAWKSNIGSSDFELALESSLRSAGLLSGGKPLGSHFLTVHLEKVDQPFIGLDMTVTASVNYVLSERASGKNVYSKSISLPYTAKFSDAFAGYERLRLANEGAAKVNIKQLIDDLIALKVESVQVK